MSSFEQALEALAMQISEMTGRPYQRGMAVTERTAPTPATTPGPPMGGPELRAAQPTVGDDVASLVRNYIGGTLGDRVAPVAGTVLDYGPMPAQIATDIAAQPVRAGQAVADAVEDPSLGRMTNAGAQTAMALFQPAKALKIVGAGFGLAGADQLGLNPIGEAEADDPAGDIPGLTPEQAQEYRKSQDIIAKGRFKTGAERRYHEGVLARYNRIQEEFAVTQNKNSAEERARKEAADQAEYDRAVRNAEQARDKALARDVRFADTPVGQFYDDMGGAATIAPIVAFGSGAISRAATGGGKTGIDHLVKQYLLPGGMGAVEGAAVNNIPQAYDIKRAPSLNPEKEAYQAYARELPPTHPRKQEYADYARGLPEVNPVVTAAKEAAGGKTWGDLVTSNAWPMLEGGVAALIGAKGASVGGRARRGEFRSQTDQPTGIPAPATPATPPPIPTAPTSGGSPPAKSRRSQKQASKVAPAAPSKTPPSGGPQPTSGGSSGHPSQFQKRGKNGQFKKGFTFKPRGAPAANQPQAPNTIAGIGQSAIKNPKPQGTP